MFLFKKIVSPLFFPVPLCLEILVLGLILIWFTKKQRAGKLAVTFGTLLLLLLSNTTMSDLLLRGLEYRYPQPAITAGSALRDGDSPVRYIVVLGGGYSDDPHVPLTSQLGEDTMLRVAEGIKLYREIPGCKLLFSAGSINEPVPESEVMSKVAQALGVGQQDIILESESRDTEDSARLVEPAVQKEPFLLVTSASHMPRSMAMFKKLEMNPIAAPTDYMVKNRGGTFPFGFYPDAGSLKKSERAVYEYLGLAWAKLRGKI
jgi:uncharacterized SAM-binding protein YcdF (DUF218 family)